MHNRNTVVTIQAAHASYIEAEYQQAMSLPGNPEGIEISNIGDTRIFLSNRNRLENRAIFTGNETEEEIRSVIDHFERKGVVGFFEINPANFYRSIPFSWKSEMVPMLIKMGCHPAAFRCVWYLDDSPNTEIQQPAISIRRFNSREVDEYIRDKFSVEPVDDAEKAREEILIRRSFTESWSNFISYENDQPVSVSKLFVRNKIGFLAWGYTLEEFRRRGHHKLHVSARVKHAFESGCDLVFSVTDFNIPSSISLQQAGFNLAYNYLLMEKRPTAL